MQVNIIENINNLPQFEPQNVFQTADYMRLFENENDTKVVLFAIYSNSASKLVETTQPQQFIDNNPTLLLLQPITIHHFLKFLPRKFGSYAIAWREPWRNPTITDTEAQQAFKALQKAINQYCRHKALYIEYRHFSENNIYTPTFNSQPSIHNFPWYNIYQQFNAGESIERSMNKSKRKQLHQSLKAGATIELNPNNNEIKEWYDLLKKLYKRIHRPLPSLQLFLNLNQSNIGKLFIVKYNNKVISGTALLYHPKSQHYYDWYRASTNEQIDGIYPSVVSTWQAMQLVADMGGGTFDFLGAGPRNKPYGVRDFKLTFGGKLTPEHRYRKYLLW